MQQTKRFDTTADHDEYCIGSWIGSMSSIAHLFGIKTCHYWIFKSIAVFAFAFEMFSLYTHSLAVIMLEVALKLFFSVLIQALVVHLSAIWLCQIEMKQSHFLINAKTKVRPNHHTNSKPRLFAINCSIYGHVYVLNLVLNVWPSMPFNRWNWQQTVQFG